MLQIPIPLCSFVPKPRHNFADSPARPSVDLSARLSVCVCMCVCGVCVCVVCVAVCVVCVCVCGVCGVCVWVCVCVVCVCVCVYDRDSSIMRWPWPTEGCCAMIKKLVPVHCQRHSLLIHIACHIKSLNMLDVHVNNLFIVNHNILSVDTTIVLI